MSPGKGKARPKWYWDARRRLAVRLLARFGDIRPLYQIAAESGVSTRTVRRWRRIPQFRNAVNRNCRAYGRRQFERRIKALQAELEAKLAVRSTYAE